MSGGSLAIAQSQPSKPLASMSVQEVISYVEQQKKQPENQLRVKEAVDVAWDRWLATAKIEEVSGEQVPVILVWLFNTVASELSPERQQAFGKQFREVYLQSQTVNQLSPYAVFRTLGLVNKHAKLLNPEEVNRLAKEWLMSSDRRSSVPDASTLGDVIWAINQVNSELTDSQKDQIRNRLNNMIGKIDFQSLDGGRLEWLINCARNISLDRNLVLSVLDTWVSQSANLKKTYPYLLFHIAQYIDQYDSKESPKYAQAKTVAFSQGMATGLNDTEFRKRLSLSHLTGLVVKAQGLMTSEQVQSGWSLIDDRVNHLAEYPNDPGFQDYQWWHLFELVKRVDGQSEALAKLVKVYLVNPKRIQSIQSATLVGIYTRINQVTSSQSYVDVLGVIQTEMDRRLVQTQGQKEFDYGRFVELLRLVKSATDTPARSKALELAQRQIEVNPSYLTQLAFWEFSDYVLKSNGMVPSEAVKVAYAVRWLNGTDKWKTDAAWAVELFYPMLSGDSAQRSLVDRIIQNFVDRSLNDGTFLTPERLGGVLSATHRLRSELSPETVSAIVQRVLDKTNQDPACVSKIGCWSISGLLYTARYSLNDGQIAQVVDLMERWMGEPSHLKATPNDAMLEIENLLRGLGTGQDKAAVLSQKLAEIREQRTGTPLEMARDGSLTSLSFRLFSESSKITPEEMRACLDVVHNRLVQSQGKLFANVSCHVVGRYVNVARRSQYDLSRVAAWLGYWLEMNPMSFGKDPIDFAEYLGWTSELYHYPSLLQTFDRYRPAIAQSYIDHVKQHRDIKLRHGVYRCVSQVFSDSSLVGLLEGVLDRPSGEANVGAGRLLACIYLRDGKAEEWSKRLVRMTEESSLSGDALASWLMLRAFTLEVTPYEPAYLAGMEWLEKAYSQATSEEYRQIIDDWVIRGLMSNRSWDQAKSKLDELAAKSDSALIQSQINRWRQEVTVSQRLDSGRQMNQQANSDRQWRLTLQARLDEAIRLGDQEQIERYQRLLAQ